MATRKNETKSEVIKTKPTIFPLGFSISQLDSGEVIILEFVDVINGTATVLESIALPKDKAAQLSATLKESLENGKSED